MHVCVMVCDAADGLCLNMVLDALMTCFPFWGICFSCSTR